MFDKKFNNRYYQVNWARFLSLPPCKVCRGWGEIETGKCNDIGEAEIETCPSCNGTGFEENVTKD